MKKIFLIAAVAAGSVLPMSAEFTVKEIVDGEEGKMIIKMEDPDSPKDLALLNATLYANGVKYPCQGIDCGLRGKQGQYTATANITFPKVENLADAHVVLKIDTEDVDVMLPGVTAETATPIAEAVSVSEVDKKPKPKAEDGKQTMFVKTDRSLGLDKPRKHYKNEQLVPKGPVKREKK